MRTVAGVDVVSRGSGHVVMTLTDERGHKHAFELTRPLAEHLEWLLSVRRPLDQLFIPEEIPEQSPRS